MRLLGYRSNFMRGIYLAETTDTQCQRQQYHFDYVSSGYVGELWLFLSISGGSYYR